MKRAIDKISIWWSNRKNGIKVMSDLEYAIWLSQNPNPKTIVL